MSGPESYKPLSGNKAETGAEKMYNEKPKKSAQDWIRVMSESGGRLAPINSAVFAGTEHLEDADWDRLYKDAEKRTDHFRLSAATEKSIVGVAKRSPDEYFPGLTDFETQFAPAWFVYSPDTQFVYAPRPLRRSLLGAAALLSTSFGETLAQLPHAVYDDTSLDLKTASAVTLDNVQTMLDVSSLLSRSVETPQEFNSLFNKLLQVCPNDEVDIDGKRFRVNPFGYTYLELFSQAPFGFWGESVRTKQPETYRGSRILSPDDAVRPVDPKFIYMITREVPLLTGDKESRHGGCPALYPAFRELDLIDRLGRLFVRAQEEFLKRDGENGSAV